MKPNAIKFVLIFHLFMACEMLEKGFVERNSVPFLKGVTYKNETVEKSGSGKVLLCKPKMIISRDAPPAGINEKNGGEFLLKEQCGLNEACSVHGATECTDMSQLKANSYIDLMAQYDERPMQLVNFALENEQSFAMYAILNDTVSNQLIQHGSFAPVLTTIVHSIARPGCAAGASGPKLVLDVGCNLGLVSLIALAHGCDVVCVEPNGALIPVLTRSLLRNRFRGHAAVIHAAAAAVWQEIRLTGCGATCAPADSGRPAPAGAHSLAWGEARPARRGEGHAWAAPLGSLLRGRALIVKVDVEGYERLAGLGLNHWLRDYGWEHLLIEARGPRRADTVAVYLQGCRGRPRIRAWRERYYEPVAGWDPGGLPLEPVDFERLRGGAAVPEDLWVTCEADSDAEAAG